MPEQCQEYRVLAALNYEESQGHLPDQEDYSQFGAVRWAEVSSNPISYGPAGGTGLQRCPGVPVGMKDTPREDRERDF